MSDSHSNVRERSRISVDVPSKYDVVIHNDDFTPMDFVVAVLKSVFFKSPSEAEHIMLMVHHSERGVAGTYSYDIAQSKAQKALNISRAAGFPLKFTVEPHAQGF